MPVIIRAETLRQLAMNEYRGEHVRLSTSAFATPSYAIGADKMYVRQLETPDPTEPQEVFYDARNGHAPGVQPAVLLSAECIRHDHEGRLSASRSIL